MCLAKELGLRRKKIVYARTEVKEEEDQTEMSEEVGAWCHVCMCECECVCVCVCVCVDALSVVVRVCFACTSRKSWGSSK